MLDDFVDPSMESLKAVDEATSAEQQAILGTRLKQKFESEEIPEQEENEQPQPIQQDDA